jgi:hypothetical protein
MRKDACWLGLLRSEGGTLTYGAPYGYGYAPYGYAPMAPIAPVAQAPVAPTAPTAQ